MRAKPAGANARAGRLRSVLVLLCEHGLRQGAAVGGGRQRVVGVDDRGLAALWVDADLEQIEEVARSGCAGDSARADWAAVVGARAYLALRVCLAGVRALRKVD